MRVESHEYMSYMEKKTSKRQTTIISLSDQNAKEIQDIHDQKQQMLRDYEEKKAGKFKSVSKYHTEGQEINESMNLPISITMN